MSEKIMKSGRQVMELVVELEDLTEKLVCAARRDGSMGIDLGSIDHTLFLMQKYISAAQEAVRLGLAKQAREQSPYTQSLIV